jgi:hypothetical protein
MTRKHWGRYQPNTSVDPYRLCLVCGHWMRNWYRGLPLIHKGKKPTWRKR